MICMRTWAIGNMMHLGSDNKRIESLLKYQIKSGTSQRVHDKSIGRDPQFGRDQNHDATVVEADKTFVHMLCSCGAKWKFTQPGSQNENFSNEKLPTNPITFKENDFY